MIVVTMVMLLTVALPPHCSIHAVNCRWHHWCPQFIEICICTCTSASYLSLQRTADRLEYWVIGPIWFLQFTDYRGVIPWRIFQFMFRFSFRRCGRALPVNHHFMTSAARDGIWSALNRGGFANPCHGIIVTRKNMMDAIFAFSWFLFVRHLILAHNKYC